MLPELSRASGLTRRYMIFSSMALGACASGAAPTDGGAGAGPSRAAGTPEAELFQRSRDLQRPMLDAAKFGILGARGVYVLGGPEGVGAGVGTIGGVIPVLFMTVSYSGYLQNEYSTDEERRARLRSDLELTNAEAEATISTMKTVISRQESRVAEAKATGSEVALQEASVAAKDSLQDMARAETGLANRAQEIMPPARRYAPPGVDPVIETQVAMLGQNNQELQSIVQSTRTNPLFVPTGI